VKHEKNKNNMKKNMFSPLPKNEKNKIVTDLAFPAAMQAIINGRKVRREEWGDKEEYCLLRENFLMIHRNGKFHAWIVSEGDLMAIDWVVV